MAEEFILSTAALAVGYGGRPLIRDIEIRLKRGEILTLIGPNGAGKSTILKTITRHLTPVAGTVYIEGTDASALRSGDMARRLSVVLTERIRPEMMTCYDVVATGRYPYTGRFGALSRRDREIIGQCLARVHAEDIAHKEFTRISDGQRQRILLARALCQEPEIIVLDEPTSFLDIRHKIELLNILLEMSREKHITVILSLHEIDLAEKISDQVMCVKGDVIATAGRPEEVFTEENIASLYGLKEGSYHVLFGSVELSAPKGEPEVFVICGGGRGIPHFRALQKRRIPFAAGILFDNDVDFVVAQSLAARVFAQPAFTPITADVAEAAMACMLRCRAVLYTGVPIMTFNQVCGDLLDAARAAGVPIIGNVDELESLKR